MANNRADPEVFINTSTGTFTSKSPTHPIYDPNIFPGGIMAYPKEGGMIQGGVIKIRFPHMDLELSCDSQLELEQAIDMIKKAFEVYQYNEAKRIMTDGEDSI